MGNEQKLIQLFKSLLYISEANRSHTSRYDFTLNSAQLQRGNRIWKKHRSWKMARISCSEFPSGHATYIIRSLSMFKIDQTQNRANFQREREREGERGREREKHRAFSKENAREKWKAAFRSATHAFNGAAGESNVRVHSPPLFCNHPHSPFAADSAFDQSIVRTNGPLSDWIIARAWNIQGWPMVSDHHC